MNVEINGRPRELEGPTSVGRLVDEEVADRRGVAVAVDGEVLPRGSWDETRVAEGTKVEIVGAVQGG